MRWELRTRPFLRTAEFLWQEGHTVHATYEEAEHETLMILHDVYADFVEQEMALPVIRGSRPKRRSSPVLRSYTLEAMMQDRALQAATSHNLGQNFAKAFNITSPTTNNPVCLDNELGHQHASDWCPDHGAPPMMRGW